MRSPLRVEFTCLVSSRLVLCWSGLTALAALGAAPLAWAEDTGRGEGAWELPPFELHEGDVYAHRMVEFPDGAVESTALGSLLLMEGDEIVGHIDPRDGVAPDGKIYLFRAAAWQDAEDGPVLYETRAALGPAPGPFEEPEPEPEPVDERFVAWLAEGDAADVRRVTANLPGFSLYIPPRTPHPDTVPLTYYEAAVGRRAEAIAAREAQVVEAQAGAVAALIDAGGSFLGSSWLDAELFVEGPPDVIGPWVDAFGLRSAAIYDDPVSDANNGLEIREATQVQQFDQHYQGLNATGRNDTGRILVGFFDNCFDIDHPAWRDCAACSSRMLAYWRHNGFLWAPVTQSDSRCEGDHANKVVGMAVADLMEAQDPNIGTLTPRWQRTGTSRESSLMVWDRRGSTLSSRTSHAITWGVDVINNSNSVPDLPTCSRSDSAYNNPVRAAYLDGIFWAQSPGNGTAFGSCNYQQPAGAAGAFTVNALQVAGGVDLQADEIKNGKRGGGPFNRNVIAMAAPGGRQSNTFPVYDDTYNIGSTGVTSFATPVVAGAAANLRDLLSVWHPAWSLDAGFMQAHMTLMGDGQLGSVDGQGPKASVSDGLDPIWGAGRLRMRMYTGVGMDYPWRVEAQQSIVAQGQTISIGANRTGPGGANQAIPIDADRLIAALWWYEPNNTAASIATIQTRTCLQGAPCASWNPQRERQRYRQMALAGGNTFTFQIEATSAPPGTGGELPYQSARKVTLAWFYEDNARDGLYGPGPEIQ